MKQTYRKPETVVAFLTEMEKDARELSKGGAIVTIEDAIHLWAAWQVVDHVTRCTDQLEGDKARRDFRKWLRNEPTRIVRLIDAARRSLAAKRRASAKREAN